MKLNNTKSLLSLMAAMTMFIFSCQKDNNTAELSTGKAIVNVKLGGIGPEDGSKLAKGSIGGSSATTAVAQQITVPFGEDLVVRATLTEVKASAGTSFRAAANKAATTSTESGEIVAFNGNYTIRAYKKIDASNEILVQTVNGLSTKSNQFELEPGNYKFVFSAYGNPTATGEDKDPLSQVIEQTVTAGNNTLNVILKHKLTEVTVKFDAGSGRTINAISGSTVKPNYNYTFDEGTGVVTFGAELAAKGFTFPTQAAAQTWTSTPVLIAVDNSNGAGEVKLANVTINNKAGNVSLTGLTLKKGVQYVLELNLGAKQGFEIGGEAWSSGNLEYNPSTGVYSFGSVNSIGNYFYAGFLRPKVLPPDPNATDAWTYNCPTEERNVAGKDPCALVAPNNTWRLPEKAEFLQLQSSTAEGGTDNPGVPVAWNAARYVDTYTPNVGSALGVFFGTQVHPGVTNRDKYLFLLLSGEYAGNNTIGAMNTQGYYLVSSGTGYEHVQIGGQKGQPAWDFDFKLGQEGRQCHAVQVRCVKK